MSEERRKEERHSIVNLDLLEFESREKIGKVINLSHSGLLAVSSQNYQVGDFHKFAIPFYNTVKGDIHFDLKARIAWSELQDTKSDSYKLGLQFVENPNLQAQFIQQMINVFGQEQASQ